MRSRRHSRNIFHGWPSVKPDALLSAAQGLHAKTYSADEKLLLYLIPCLREKIKILSSRCFSGSTGLIEAERALQQGDFDFEALCLEKGLTKSMMAAYRSKGEASLSGGTQNIQYLKQASCDVETLSPLRRLRNAAAHSELLIIPGGPNSSDSGRSILQQQQQLPQQKIDQECFLVARHSILFDICQRIRSDVQRQSPFSA